jgi:hypothetical protein
VRSRYTLLQSIDLDLMNTLFDQMCAEALAVVRQSDASRPIVTLCGAFMRYNGQVMKLRSPCLTAPWPQTTSLHLRICLRWLMPSNSLGPCPAW